MVIGDRIHAASSGAGSGTGRRRRERHGSRVGGRHEPDRRGGAAILARGPLGGGLGCEELQVGVSTRVGGLQCQHLAPAALGLAELAARVCPDSLLHQLRRRHGPLSSGAPPDSPLNSWSVRSSCSSSVPSWSPSCARIAAWARCTIACALFTASLPKRLRASAAVTAGASASISPVIFSVASRGRPQAGARGP